MVRSDLDGAQQTGFSAEKIAELKKLFTRVPVFCKCQQVRIPVILMPWLCCHRVKVFSYLAEGVGSARICPAGRGAAFFKIEENCKYYDQGTNAAVRIQRQHNCKTEQAADKAEVFIKKTKSRAK